MCDELFATKLATTVSPSLEKTQTVRQTKASIWYTFLRGAG
jgi:hypothetical protein